MPLSPRLIRRRIRSIRSTRKIMKAMELVAASKMRKAVQATLSARPYSEDIRELVHEAQKLLPRDRRASHPFFLSKRASGQASYLLTVFASDRGLCGGFNSQLLKTVIKFCHEHEKDQISIITVGRRAESLRRCANVQIVASFPSYSPSLSFSSILPLAELVKQMYLKEEFHHVMLAYMDFQSILKQIPTVRTLLPIIADQKQKKDWFSDDGVEEPHAFVHQLFEPSSESVFEFLLPCMVDLQIYQAVLETTASEHSARMVAMKSASDAALDMLESLTVNLNQARQSVITREISEISAGKTAIE